MYKARFSFKPKSTFVNVDSFEHKTGKTCDANFVCLLKTRIDFEFIQKIPFSDEYE